MLHPFSNRYKGSASDKMWTCIHTQIFSHENVLALKPVSTSEIFVMHWIHNAVLTKKQMTFMTWIYWQNFSTESYFLDHIAGFWCETSSREPDWNGFRTEESQHGVIYLCRKMQIEMGEKLNRMCFIVISSTNYLSRFSITLEYMHCINYSSQHSKSKLSIVSLIVEHIHLFQNLICSTGQGYNR